MVEQRRWPRIRLLARAALPLAALALIAFALSSPRASEAHHLCTATGSLKGPFDIQTYEAYDYRTVYGETMDLAGSNELFPTIESFAVPELNSGPRDAQTEANPFIPPVLLKAIGSIESSWAQADYSVPYGGVGEVLTSHDCGYGIMQVTSGMQNVVGVPNLDQAMIGGHFAFNIARGSHILAEKWNLAPDLRPIVGDADPETVENWYFALWGYNGFAFQNHPRNPAFSPQRAPFSCGPDDDGFGHDRTSYPYQELVLGCAEHPPMRSGALLWEPQAVHLPDLADPEFAGPLDVSNWTNCSQSAKCAAMDIPTPNTSHAAQTLSLPLREDVIGSPTAQVSHSKVDLISIPGVKEGSVNVTVANSGTGVLAYRVTTTAPWFTVSRSQGVSLGTDLGGKTSTFKIQTDTAALAPGTYSGQVVIDSLYASGAPKKISVTISNFPTGALIAGSGPKVYVVSSGLKRWIPNGATFEANGFSWNKIMHVEDSVLDAMQTGNTLPDVLADGNLIASTGRPEVYVMQSGAKRHVTSRSAMIACGFSFADVRRMSTARINAVDTGDPLSGPPCPRLAPANGSLVQGYGSAVYVMRDGIKRLIPNDATFDGMAFHRGNVDTVGGSLLAGVPTGYPLASVLADGTLLKGAAGKVYVMSNGSKRLIGGNLVMSACGYDALAAYTLPQERLDKIPDTVPLVAPPCPRVLPGEGRLVKGDGTEAIYVMRGGLKRHVPDSATLEANKFLSANVDTYHQSIVATIPTGAALLSVLADGSLIKGSGDVVYVMQLGVRRSVSAGVMSQCGYGSDAISVISDARIAQIPSGAPLLGPPCVDPSFATGTLLTGSGPEVYVIQSGQKRHISSRAAFNACGYKWGNINAVANSTLALLPTGSSVDGAPCP